MNNYWGLNIPKVEKKYDAKYVGDFNINKSPTVLAVFYVENPDKSKGHSNYFGLYGVYSSEVLQDLAKDRIIPPTFYICNAEKILDETYPALELPNGELLISTYRHDFKMVEINGEQYMLDYDYLGCHICSTNTPLIFIKVTKDKLVKC